MHDNAPLHLQYIIYNITNLAFAMTEDDWSYAEKPITWSYSGYTVSNRHKEQTNGSADGYYYYYQLLLLLKNRLRRRYRAYVSLYIVHTERL